METLLMLFSFSIITIIYYSGKFLFILKSGMFSNHYFLGYGPKLGRIKIRSVNFSIGIIIPLFPFFKIYKIEEGIKVRIPSPWEFDDFTFWKKLTVIYGGIITLIIAGIFILTVVAFTDKENYISREEVNRIGVIPTELGFKLGFKRGDKILLMNGKEYENFNEILNPFEAKNYTILRDHKTINLDIEQKLTSRIEIQDEGLFSLDAPFQVERTIKNSPADHAGLKCGDKILSVSGTVTSSLPEFRQELLKFKEREVELTIERKRGAEKLLLNLKVKPDQKGMIGFSPRFLINYSTKEYSLFESLGLGIKTFIQIGYNNVTAFIRIFSGEIVNSRISGPINIAREFGGFSWRTFWVLTAGVISNIVLLNFLPLPASCLWELIPLMYNGITKNKFPYRNVKYLKILSYLLFAALLVYQVALDIARII